LCCQGAEEKTPGRFPGRATFVSGGVAAIFLEVVVLEVVVLEVVD
jgi:hypothetical protein